MSILEVKEGIQEQGASEAIAWPIDVSNQTSAPTSPDVVSVIDLSTGRNVESTVMPTGISGVDGTIITLPLLQNLTPGRDYKVYFKWTDGSETKEAFIRIRCPQRDE